MNSFPDISPSPDPRHHQPTLYSSSSPTSRKTHRNPSQKGPQHKLLPGHLSPPRTYPFQQLFPKTIETLHKKARSTVSCPPINMPLPAKHQFAVENGWREKARLWEPASTDRRFAPPCPSVPRSGRHTLRHGQRAGAAAAVPSGRPCLGGSGGAE